MDDQKLQNFFEVGEAILSVANKMLQLHGGDGCCDFDFGDVDEESAIVDVSDPCRCGQGCWDESLDVPMPFVLRHLAEDSTWEDDYREKLAKAAKAAKARERIERERLDRSREAAERRELRRLTEKYGGAP